MAVKMIGNETDIMNIDLKSILPPAIVMVVNVTSTTSLGRLLTQDELNRVNNAVDIALELDKAKKDLTNYVKSRMSYIAPNLTQIVGSEIAAKLMGIAGGLVALSRIPACNLIVLGASKKANLGLSRVYMGQHAGVVYQCDAVSNSPDHIKRQAARLVSAKCALAARVDCAKESPDGHIGRSFRDDINRKIEALMQPLASKAIKALPVPVMEMKKKRGGKQN